MPNKNLLYHRKQEAARKIIVILFYMWTKKRDGIPLATAVAVGQNRLSNISTKEIPSQWIITHLTKTVKTPHC